MDRALLARSALLAAAVFSYLGGARAYEGETHRLISLAAVRASRSLGSAATGIYDRLDLPAGGRYPDVEGRFASIAGLIGLGAIYEDTLQVSRPLNHFFDPQHGGRPLTVAGVALGFASPDWALEDRGVLPKQLLKPEQLHSLRCAADYLRDALTLAEEGARRRNFGLTFQTLGQVIHHIQDMAQPQHVRNDAHLSYVDTSRYEHWTNDRRNQLPFGGYPLPEPGAFRTARSFWQRDGAGMADFTATNFVSADTNFTAGPEGFAADEEYPRPAVASHPPVEKIALSALLGPAAPAMFADAQVWFLGAQVTDVNQPSRSKLNRRASTYSIFGQDLGIKSSPPLARRAGTTLNRFNFAAAHEFLIPRAVSYSAGLIDYFFRGRLALEALELAGGLATVKVRNVSAGDFGLRERTGGGLDEFSIYYDAQDGRRRRLPLAGGDLAGQVFAAGASRTLTFTPPADLDARKDKPFMLVFDGLIGEERGIAALAFEAPAPRGLLAQPDYTPADGIAGPRLISFDGSGWKLMPQESMQAGNVDWRGDEPGEVLTWDGPPSRYFYPAQVQGYSPRIYYHGRLLTHAPANVQGVAVRTEGGARWLTVAVYIGNELRLYVRPFRGQYVDDGLYDAQVNPEGWRLLHAESMGLPSTPTFFNSSGTEAQTLVRDGGAATDRFRKRVKLHIGSAVTVETVGAKGSGAWRKQTVNSYTPQGAVLEGSGEVCPERAVEYACRNSGSCTDELGNIYEVCRDARREWRLDAISAFRASLDYVFDIPTVVCADYRGETEVLGRIARDAASVESVEFERRVDEVDTQTTDAACTVRPGSQSKDAVQGGRFAVSSDVRRLQFGSIDIPLTGHRQENTFRESTTLALDSEGLKPSGSATVEDESVSYDTRILYLDLRNDIAVVDMHDQLRTLQAGSGAPFRNVTAWSYAFDEVFNTQTRQTLLAYLGGQSHVLYSDAPAGSSSAGSSTYLSGLGNGSPPACLARETNDPGAPQPFVDDFAIDRFLLLNPAGTATAPLAQGYAVDAAGRIAASQTVWVRQANGAYAAQGVWNFLSQGDLSRTIPVAPVPARFFPLGTLD